MKGRPIIWSITWLVLGSGTVAWAACLALVLFMPHTTEEGPAIADVVRVLKRGSATGERYLVLSRESTPSLESAKSDVEQAAARSVAQGLGDGREILAEVKSFILPTFPSGRLSLDEAIQNRSFRMPRSKFAARNPDGSWSVVRAPAPLLSSQNLMIVGSFLLLGLFLIPFAFLVARRWAVPMRELAAWAQNADLGSGSDLELNGSRELQQVAVAFADMRRRLGSQMKERTVMLAAVAHDLRTPLTALRVRSEASPPKSRDKMAADIERMERMIAQFLAFVSGSDARSASGAVDLAQVVQTVTDDAEDGGLPINWAPTKPLVVQGNFLDLQRMLRNLVENALRYGTRAEVRIDEAGGSALLVVADDGPGLPEEELERVFQPFYRPDVARNSATGGSGLGLAIVQMIARAHGGEVTLRNLVPHGLEAEVRLPLNLA